MDLKAYSFIWLSVSDYPSLYPRITKISLLQAKSQGSITLVGISKSATIDFLLAWNR